MKNNKTNKIYISKGNVIDDLGFSPEEAAVVKLKIDLHSEILRVIEKKKISPRNLEKILDEPQPRISELLNGKLSKLSPSKLTTYLHRLGRAVEVRTKAAS